MTSKDEMMDENCKACEGYGVVATTKTDLDGYHIEAECPLCFPDNNLSPPVPDDVVKNNILQINAALAILEIHIPSLIRAASTPSAEVRALPEITVEDILRSANVGDPIAADVLISLAEEYPNGLKIINQPHTSKSVINKGEIK